MAISWRIRKGQIVVPALRRAEHALSLRDKRSTEPGPGGTMWGLIEGVINREIVAQDPGSPLRCGRDDNRRIVAYSAAA